ncbi:hypothetical protein [Rubritalea sp.]|uniref:hypothetical protein n=1 Tax=Rubritalea sp. TaxID=2109375 RepID=UPI003EFA8289
MKPSTVKRRKLLLILTAVFVLLISGGALAYWYFNRPITPTVLTGAEQIILDKKVTDLEDPSYQPGSKDIIFTEREVNALIHHNTTLGDKLKIEFARDAIHARVRTDLDPDLPILGGKELKARARFKISSDQDTPSLILDDVTLWGISLPNAWLAELKGQNLLSNIGLEQNQISRGIEELKVEHGEIHIRLAE